MHTVFNTYKFPQPSYLPLKRPDEVTHKEENLANAQGSEPNANPSQVNPSSQPNNTIELVEQRPLVSQKPKVSKKRSLPTVTQTNEGDTSGTNPIIDVQEGKKKKRKTRASKSVPTLESTQSHALTHGDSGSNKGNDIVMSEVHIESHIDDSQFHFENQPPLTSEPSFSNL